MTTRRLASSTIDWAEFAKKIPAHQKAAFNAIKIKQDGYVRAINSLPAELPKIDFAHYRNRIAVSGMVDDFEKKWAALKIPYPVDNLSSGIDAEAVQAKSNFDKLVTESQARIATTENKKKEWESMLPIEEMNREEALEAVPWLSIDVKNPTHYPHDEKMISTIDLEAHFSKTNASEKKE